jgi:hypothetical protein
MGKILDHTLILRPRCPIPHGSVMRPGLTLTFPFRDLS